MEKYISIIKKTTFTITTLLFLIIILIVFFSVNGPNQPQTQTPRTCIDINDEETLAFAGCYDAFSQNIFFEIHNNNFASEQTTIQASFFDYLQKSYTFNVPKPGESIFQKIPAEVNPLSIDIYVRGQQNIYCSTPKQVQVTYCPADLSDSKNAIVELVSKTNINNFTTVGSPSSDQLQEGLVDKEKIWQSICRSNWECGEWGDCINNIQKRDCQDKNLCGIPTNLPQRVRTCNAVCVEDWQCEWSTCEAGYTTPSCIDLNNCGTTINKPTQIPCAQQCVPDIICGNWGECEADYDFLTLSNGNYILEGTQKRQCIDQNSCIATTNDFQNCSLTLDIYTTDLVKCGKEYVSLYNALDNILLATIEKNEIKEIVNIDLSSEKSVDYCDFCFDGILNGDEEQIDCGGSCEPCDVLRVDNEFSKTFGQRLWENIRRFLS